MIASQASCATAYYGAKRFTFVIKNQQLVRKKRRKRVIPGLVLVCCLFIGFACGLVWDNLLSGILIGLGSGFVVMAILRYILIRKPAENTSNHSEDNS